MSPDGLLPSVARLLAQYPALLPAVFCFFFFPAFVIISRSPTLTARLLKLEPRLAITWGLVCLGLFAFCDLAYLSYPTFFYLFESAGVSVSYTLFHGGIVYPDLSSEERYCLPYGPVLYIVLGLSQWLLGASVFSTKLPCCLAPAFAIFLFWRILRVQRVPAVPACMLVGLEAAILLAFRIGSFWTKSDPLILLLVTAGIWAARRHGTLAVMLLGACIGLAIDLKASAAAYFLPVLVIAFHAGWRTRGWAFCGVVLIGTALAPFALLPRQLPWVNYLAFLRVVSNEGLDRGTVIGVLRWIVMMAGLIFVSDFCMQKIMTRQDRRWYFLYRAALAFGIALVSVPASAIGAGQGHFLPFIPLVLLSFKDVWMHDADPKWRLSPRLIWRAPVYAILAACALVSMQTAFRIVQKRLELDKPAAACNAQLREIIARHRTSTILMGTAGDADQFPAIFRYELVFAGNPIALDAAVVSDYQAGGVSEPNMPCLLAEIGSRDARPICWLLPRGGAPFSGSNFYDGMRPIYSEEFRRDFADRFELRESTTLFDLYFAKKDQ
jgi:hypothetical protein